MYCMNLLKTKNYKLKTPRGFSLVEVVVGSALLAIVSLSVYQAYASVMKLSRGSGDKVVATLLANEQIEILHNLPYASVGEIGGIPAGLVTHSTTTVRDGVSFNINTTIRNVDDPFDGTFPTDTAPSDYKLASVVVTCTACTQTTVVSLTTTIAPKNLENVTTNGALFLTVLNALGAPLSGATVNITNAGQGLNFTDTTDVNGLLKVYDVIPASIAYAVTVTKSGYSTDKTYDVTGSNPSPTKRALTTAVGTVTSSTFSIDSLASLAVTSKDSSCTAIGNYDFTLQGYKTIGTNNGASVYKYSTPQVTSGAGALTVNSLEWDTYSILPTSSSYDLAGVLPVASLTVTPGQAATAGLILKPKNSSALMVVVKDQATHLPVSGATVTLTGSGSPKTLTTGVGSLSQSNWVGGAGQANFTDVTKFYDSDGNIKITTAGQLSLLPQGAVYPAAGWLTSSTFDLLTAGSLYKVTWIPTGQSANLGTDPVKFQVASNNDNSTWSYIGPDGTASSYYTTTLNTVGNEHANKRYFRYKMLMSTASSTLTPTVNNITFQFTTACTPSAEVLFQGLTQNNQSTLYTLSITAPGYADFNQSDVLVSTNWQEYDVPLSKN